MPDLIILQPGTDGSHGLLVEIKAPNGKPSAEQLAWLAVAKSRGYRGAVCYSLKEFQEVCRQHVAVVL